MITPHALVDAGIYPDEQTAIREAMRTLWQEHPQVKIEWAIHQYQTQDMSLAKAAAFANVCFDRMKEILLQRGIQPRLGAETVNEARQELDALQGI